MFNKTLPNPLTSQIQSKYSQINTKNNSFIKQPKLHSYQFQQSITNSMVLLSSIISSNNQIFSNIIQIHEVFSHTLDAISSLIQKQEEKQIQKKFLWQKSEIIYKQIIQVPQTIHSIKLKNQLFGQGFYKYSLALVEQFSFELYKQRNFKIQLCLINKLKQQVINCNPIPIGLCAYDSNIKAQLILESRDGKPIFKGNCQSELIKGYARFEKLQFREISSIYIERCVNFVIYAKCPSFRYCLKQNEKEMEVDYGQIQPLVLSQIQVRSKR